MSASIVFLWIFIPIYIFIIYMGEALKEKAYLKKEIIRFQEEQRKMQQELVARLMKERNT